MWPTIKAHVLLYQHTVNVDIFACRYFCGFIEMGNFARIKIGVLL